MKKIICICICICSSFGCGRLQSGGNAENLDDTSRVVKHTPLSSDPANLPVPTTSTNPAKSPASVPSSILLSPSPNAPQSTTLQDNCPPCVGGTCDDYSPVPMICLIIAGITLTIGVFLGIFFPESTSIFTLLSLS